MDSIFHQTTQYSYEVILVDDGSTDNSVGVIEARKENNIVLYRQQNAGPAAARNRGVELAKGRYIAFIDADDYWNDGYIEQTIKFLDEHKECVAVSVGCKSISLGNSPRFCPYTSMMIQGRSLLLFQTSLSIGQNFVLQVLVLLLYVLRRLNNRVVCVGTCVSLKIMNIGSIFQHLVNGG